jgi:hypothetical protein
MFTKKDILSLARDQPKNNGVSCAKALHVNNSTITDRLNDGKPVKNKEGLISALTVKRIKAYSPKSSA